jgi:hypothetical protein
LAASVKEAPMNATAQIAAFLNIVDLLCFVFGD